MTQFLLSMLARSMLLGSIGLVALWLARHRAPAVRHVIAAGTVFAMMALPVVSFLAPAVRVHVTDAPAAVFYLSQSRPIPTSSASAQVQPVPSPPAPAEAIAEVWLGASFLLIGRILFGLGLCAVRVRSSGKLHDSPQGIRVLEDARTDVPLTLWAGRFYIVLPPEQRHWDASRRSHVLAHEAAHVRRRDWTTQTLMQLGCALLWPNPLIWMLTRQARYLAECSADACVLDHGVPPDQYAADLLDLVRRARHRTAPLAIPMAAKADISRRIEMILNYRSGSHNSGRVSAFVLATSLLLAGIPLATWAFQKLPTAQSTSAASGRSISMLIHFKIYQSGAHGGSIFKHKLAVDNGIDCKSCHQTVQDNSNQLHLATALVLGNKVADKLESQAKQLGANLIGSPTIRALANQAATISVDSDGKKLTVEVTGVPTQDKVALNFVIKRTQGGDLLEKLSAIAAASPDQTIVVFGRANSGQIDMIALVTATRG